MKINNVHLISNLLHILIIIFIFHFTSKKHIHNYFFISVQTACLGWESILYRLGYLCNPFSHALADKLDDNYVTGKYVVTHYS